MHSVYPRLTAALFLAGIPACASAPPPTVQTGPDAEVTVDGLHRVDNAQFGRVYVKPDLDLSAYTKFMLHDASVAYQRDPRGQRRARAGNAENYELTATQMGNLKEWFREAIVSALTDGDGYMLVDEAGPDVLEIQADLIDLVVRIPTESIAARDRTYTRSYGEVTLVFELRDSASGEVLVRAADRRDPTRNTDARLAEVSPSFVRGDTRMMFNYWAGLLRTRLDEIRSVDLP
jgi:hypothetical protein